MSLSSRRGQKTLKKRVSLRGIGVHSGQMASVTLCPAEPDSGISFLRIDVPGASDLEIRAVAARVGSTELCTVLGDPHGICVATIEHLLAALVGLGVDNAVVEIDGAEVPVMDGSARAFVAAIDEAGLVVQNSPRRFIRIRKPVRVELGAAYAEFRPYDGRRFEVGIAYDCAVIGQQSYGIDLTPRSFRAEVAGARTFGYVRDVERLWAAGYALGSSLDNSVVIDDGAVINPDGLRYSDEFVRHKLLDAIGDIALAGAPIQGLYRSFKGGHRLNALALSTLLARTDAWTLVTAPRERVRQGEKRIDLFSGILTPAFAPDVS